MFTRILLVVGAAIFLDGAYSVYVERIHLHGGTSLHYTPSTKLICQLVGAFLILVVGIILSAPPLKEIYWKNELKQRSIDSFDTKISFINLNNRASILYGDS
ncbi:hypothetical protein O181_071618 [Austropuccinia psidii MF-1]|uniref:Uncharacterized protein n=1 Tax=Austropuccinia psidii MF-1 TaxID=1389203 RepID=A0A9Q3F1D4_9BASI|nr:hypothetical protein [Austropuccinia psidii MF-1]